MTLNKVEVSAVQQQKIFNFKHRKSDCKAPIKKWIFLETEMYCYPLTIIYLSHFHEKFGK